MEGLQRLTPNAIIMEDVLQSNFFVVAFLSFSNRTISQADRKCTRTSIYSTLFRSTTFHFNLFMFALVLKLYILFND